MSIHALLARFKSACCRVRKKNLPVVPSEAKNNLPSGLRAEHSGDWVRLLRNLPHLRGFHAFILQHNLPTYRDTLIFLLHEGEDETTHAIWDLNTLGGFDAFELALYQMNESKQRPKNLHIINFESLDEDAQKYFIKGLNYHRDALAEYAQTTLFFWLLAHDLLAIQRNAPDFWSWREQVIDFSVPVQAPERSAYDGLALTELESDKKRQRIADISAYLATQAKDKPLLSNGDLYKEMGTLYEALSDYEAARQAYQQARQIFKQLDEHHAELQVQRNLAHLSFLQGDPDRALSALNLIVADFEKLQDLREQALTLGVIGDIYEQRGDLDTALEIGEDKQLSIYEKIGDNRAKAVTVAKIADIHYRRGELDNALTELEEAVTIFDRLGNTRDKAVAMGKIADIHYQRGEWDKALAIRQNEELPVFERLGDSRSKAVTMGKIADIHYQRGEWDKALAIRENEELPVYERLGDSHSKAISMGKIATILWQQNPEVNAGIVRDYLNQALAIFKAMKLPRETTWVEEKLVEIDAFTNIGEKPT